MTDGHAASLVLKPLVCAFGFLTRLPVPNVSLSDEDVGKSAGYFAWVGGAIAALLWVVWWGTEALGPRISAALVIASWAALTGAFHLDGLADTVDGLSGGRGDKTRSLEIMRDSRIGAHGAVALAIALILKWALLEEAFIRGDLHWLIAPIVARFSCTVLLSFFAYARSQGLGSAFQGRVSFVEILVGLVAVGVAHSLVWPADPWLLPAGLCAALALAFYARKRLGGLTGDVHGAAIEVAELAVLFTLAIPT